MDGGKAPAVTSANEQRKRSRESMAETSLEQKPDAARVKRQRVSRACDQCRAGREKCDGLKPVCGTCTLSARTCTYATQAKKRGIQPGYIRTLELSLSWLFSNFPSAESVLKKQLAVENGPVQRLLSGKDATECDRAHAQWTKGIICKQIDQLLSGAEVLSPTEIDIEDPGDDREDVLTENAAASTSFSNDGNRSQTSKTASRLIFATETTPSMTRLRLPDDFWALLDIYYTFTHSWLPISEKHDILKTAYSYPPDGAIIDFRPAGSGKHAELWSIFALAAHQTRPRKSDDEIDALIASAQSLTAQEPSLIEIGHVKASINLALVSIGQGQWQSAWISIGSAIRAAQILGLHRPTNSHLPREKHVFLACYLLEHVVGRHLSIPMHLESSDVEAVGYLEEDGLEEWNPWDGGANGSTMGLSAPPRVPSQSLSTFNQLIRLMQDATHDDLRNHSHDSSRRGSSHLLRVISSTPTNMICTPQQVHLQAMALWVAAGRGAPEVNKLKDNLTTAFGNHVRSYGESIVTPTIAALIPNLMEVLDPRGANPMLQSLNSSLSQIWQRKPDTTLSLVPNPVAQTSSQYAGNHSGSVVPQATTAFDAPRSTISRQSTAHALPSYNNLQVVTPVNNAIQEQMTVSSTASQSTPPVPHIGIPVDAETMQQSSHNRAQGQQRHTSMTSAPDYSMGQGPSPSADLDAIFEEIAMLDGPRQADDRPQFMRNLGFGPDLDLANFFGADYQSSDPILSYLQSDAFGPLDGEGNIFGEGG